MPPAEVGPDLGALNRSALGAFPLARNEMNGAEDDEAASSSEMTGPTSSLDGRTPFANVQEPVHTLAITGPFERHLR